MSAILFPYTGLLGALALLAWAGSLYVLVRVMRKPSRPRVYLLALGLALLASMFYRMKNEYWYSSVKLDRTEEIRKQREAQKALEAEDQAEAEAEAAEQQAKEASGPDAPATPTKVKNLAAGLSFSEEAPEDLVQGGYSEATPTWRERGPKVRTLPTATNQLAKAGGTNQLAGAGATASLDAEDAGSAEANAMALEAKAEATAIYMKGAQLRVVRMVHRLSRMLNNLLLIAVWLTILWNYVVRFNAPWNTWWPLPLSGAAIDAFSPKSPAQTLRPDVEPYAPPEAFLGRAIRKGENVIYLGRRPLWASQASVPRLSLFIPWFGDHADTVWPQARAWLLRCGRAVGRTLARSLRFALNRWHRISPAWHRHVQATIRVLERMDDQVQRTLGDLSRGVARVTGRRGGRVDRETGGTTGDASVLRRLAGVGRSLGKGTVVLALALARLGARVWRNRSAGIRGLARVARGCDAAEAYLFRTVPRGLARLWKWTRALLRGLGTVGRWLGRGLITWPPQLVRYVRLLRRGERKITFVEIPLWCIPILRYGGAGLPTGSEFAFDAAWFGRYVSIVSGDAPCREMLEDMADIMSERRQSGAVAKRTLLIVWDRDEALSDALRTRLAQLAEEGNLSFLTWQRGPNG
jgi:hypothetical protein